MKPQDATVINVTITSTPAGASNAQPADSANKTEAAQAIIKSINQAVDAITQLAPVLQDAAAKPAGATAQTVATPPAAAQPDSPEQRALFTMEMLAQLLKIIAPLMQLSQQQQQGAGNTAGTPTNTGTGGTTAGSQAGAGKPVQNDTAKTVVNMLLDMMSSSLQELQKLLESKDEDEDDEDADSELSKSPFKNQPQVSELTALRLSLH